MYFWTVTSRAVVGSSATRNSGSPARAMAIITRWRMPPDSSWGYWSRRLPGSGMPTEVNSSIGPLRAPALSRPRCMRSGSNTCLPTFMTGLSDVIGSWKIIPIRDPQ